MSTRSDETLPADAGQLVRGVGRPVPKRAKLTPLKQRIVSVLSMQPRCRMSYYDLGLALWPAHLYPRAGTYSSNGGPPGWAMPLGRALRELSVAGIAHENRPAHGGKGRGDVVLLSADAWMAERNKTPNARLTAPDTAHRSDDE